MFEKNLKRFGAHVICSECFFRADIQTEIHEIEEIDAKQNDENGYINANRLNLSFRFFIEY
jgi:hypothetical protein